MNTLFDMNNEGVLTISVEAYSLLPFKEIWDGDKSKNKELALKELAFIFFYCDIKSNYMITPEEDRAGEIIKDIGLPSDWSISKVEKALEYYNQHSKSIIVKLYESSLHSANEVAEYLKDTRSLLDERTEKGATVTNVSQITAALKSVPIIMRDLKAAYKEVIKEKDDSEDKKKGKQRYNTFETGLSFE